MRVTFIPVALVAVALVALRVSADDFEADDLNDGDFEISRGASNCPKKFKFMDEDRRLTAGDIRADGAVCTGSGTLNLKKNPNSGGTRLTAFLRQPNIRKDRDDSLEASLNGALNCAKYPISSGSYFQFFSPEDSFRVNISAIFSNSHPLSGNGKLYTFKEDRDYFILSDRCIYDRPVLASVCFPSDAQVVRRTGPAAISELSIGDEVLVAPGVYSSVFMWTHMDANFARRAYIRLTTESGKAITLTPGHYIHLSGGRGPVPASKVRVGDALVSASGSPDVVLARDSVHAKGLYNPQTLHGDIVVDGFVATTYTTAIAPQLAHALLAPLRGLYAACRSVMPRSAL